MTVVIEAGAGEASYHVSARACDHARNNPKDDVYVEHNGNRAKVYASSFCGDVAEKLYLYHEIRRMKLP